MKRKKRWIIISIFNLTVVSVLGLILRSKIVFPLPFINYNNLLESHFHFAFGGWVTLVLMVLTVYEFLPDYLNEKPVYKWIFNIIFFTSWLLLLTYYYAGNCLMAKLFSAAFIFSTWIYGLMIIKDIQKANTSKTIALLVISSVICLIISSFGPFALDYLYAVESTNAILYRDALYGYLHFQYNGFFTLGIFSFLFHFEESNITPGYRRNLNRFSVSLIISILFSLFLTFLWHDPNTTLRILAIAGSLTILLSLILFLLISKTLTRSFHSSRPIVKYMVLLSMCAFILKFFLQSLTIFPKLGDAVFGDRPMIIGFLHLVFLGFVTVFILGYLGQIHILDTRRRLTKAALIIFSSGVIIMEVTLITQGLGAMFFKSSYLVPWLLWGTSILLFAGSVMITASCLIYSHSYDE
jgi:hypothetical protein